MNSGGNEPAGMLKLKQNTGPEREADAWFCPGTPEVTLPLFALTEEAEEEEAVPAGCSPGWIKLKLKMN